MKRIAQVRLPLLDDARTPVRVASRVAFALLCAGGGLAAVSALEPILSRPYYFPAFAAIIVPAVLIGGRYGAITTLAFGFGFAYWHLAPRGALEVKNPHELASLLAYTITGCFVAAIGGQLRGSFRELRDQHHLLDRIHAQREDLIRALTHDIRSPLNVIAMNAALLSRTVAARDPEALRRTRLIESSVASAASMLRDLVEVAALESGQVRVDLAPVDLTAMLERVRDGVAGEDARRVRIDPPQRELPAVHADPQRLERVLVNVVSNALKYSSGPVTIRLRQHDGGVVVSVRDEGPGIDAQDLPHLFEKYYRASDARPKEGLGLGLYISRLLVEAHGGRIWAESEGGGKGATFHVAIPAQAPHPRAARTPADPVA